MVLRLNTIPCQVYILLLINNMKLFIFTIILFSFQSLISQTSLNDFPELLEFSSLIKQKKDSILTFSRFVPDFLFHDLNEKNIISNKFKIDYLKKFHGKSEIFEIDADSSEYAISSIGKFFISDIIDAYIFQIKGFSCGTGYKIFLVTYDNTSNKFIQETCVYSVEICGSSEFVKIGALYDINNDKQYELVVSNCLNSLSEVSFGINGSLEIYSFDKNEFKKIQIKDALKNQIISKLILPCNYE